MDLAELIEGLSAPAAYPQPVEKVEVRQTHISVVFLTGEHVYKLKKPVKPTFLDFSTLEKLLHYCREEVRLNRRLAPDVYLNVVPVVRTMNGLKWEAEGEAIEWAVKMRRLPEEATLLERLRRDAISVEPERRCTRQGFAADLQQNSCEFWHALFRATFTRSRAAGSVPRRERPARRRL